MIKRSDFGKLKLLNLKMKEQKGWMNGWNLSKLSQYLCNQLCNWELDRHTTRLTSLMMKLLRLSWIQYQQTSEKSKKCLYSIKTLRYQLPSTQSKSRVPSLIKFIRIAYASVILEGSSLETQKVQSLLVILLFAISLQKLKTSLKFSTKNWWVTKSIRS